MPQTTNRIFDEFARLMTDAAGVARGVRDEAETVMRTQAERVLRELDVVQREEFEAVREMAARAREENESLKARVDALEARLARAGSEMPQGGSATGARKTAPRRKPRTGGPATPDA